MQKNATGEDSRRLRSERYYGSVSRRFELPTDIDLEQAQAEYSDGVLHLVLPKRKPAKNSRKLTIK